VMVADAGNTQNPHVKIAATANALIFIRISPSKTTGLNRYRKRDQSVQQRLIYQEKTSCLQFRRRISLQSAAVFDGLTPQNAQGMPNKHLLDSMR